VVGDGEALGVWDASKAPRMSRKTMLTKSGAASSVWELVLELVTGVAVNYKYLIIGRDRRVKWESSKAEFRTVVPTGFETVVVDGAFGRDVDEVWVDEGWLNSEVQVRLELGYYDPLDGTYTPPITGLLLESNSTTNTASASTSSEKDATSPGATFASPPAASQPPMSLHFFDGNSLLSREVVPLPIPDKWNEVVFHMNELEKLKITVEVYDRRHVDPSTRFNGESQTSNENERLARTCISRAILKEMRGLCSVPLFNSQLEHVGTLNFKYLVVTPFKHPLNNLDSIWKSYTRAAKPVGKSVGHRGCGSTRTTFISENTILSFLTAADYGADYVEFDVQMTNEDIPVINHDFHIPVTSNEGDTLNIPVSSLNKKQFKSLRPSSSSDYESPLTTIFHKMPGLKRSKSMTLVPKSRRRRSYRQQKKQFEEFSSSDESRPNGDAVPSDSSTETSERPLMTSTSIDSLDLHGARSVDSPAPHATLEATWTATPIKVDDPFDLLSPRPTLRKSIINPHDQFATLDETLRLVPAEVGFVIEVKFPAERFQHSSKMRYAERNVYADAVLKCVFNAMQNPQLASRKIMLISFDPDLCVLLSQKQPRFPVLFLLCLGHGIPVGEGDEEIEGYDPRCQSLEVATRFAKSVRLQGVICDAASVLSAPEYYVSTTHEASLLLMTYGADNMDAQKRQIQKAAGVDSLIMDNVVHINRDTRARKQVSSLFLADYGRQHFVMARAPPTSTQCAAGLSSSSSSSTTTPSSS